MSQPLHQSLEVGSVRGGGCLHREALTLLGVAGSGEKPRLNAIEFAEMTVATVLAGETNLVVAIAAEHLTRAHEKLGGGNYLKKDIKGGDYLF
jgi:hydroxymethylglutaryl-CoA reductase (NADPH)